ncbi:hypothetical protein [Labrys neptuniae]|uniref:Ankyrin repeat domain-containing protein n=1 Tax=Labrys neptuniae TaxID=376174 RepID=A0ABV3PW89_9HYPH
MVRKTGKKERLYVIGDRGVGILIIKLKPLRVVQISDEEISRYGKSLGGDGYAKIGALLWRVIADHNAAEGQGRAIDSDKIAGIESLIETGADISDVEFVFKTNISTVSLQAGKQHNKQIKSALCHLINGAKGEESTLFDAILNDSGSDDNKC